MFTLCRNFNCCTAPGKNLCIVPHHYDQEVLSGEVQMFFKALTTSSQLCKFAFIGRLYLFPLYCSEAPNTRVTYVAHRTVMSQSIPTGYIPPGNPGENFFERANPGHPGKFFCRIPCPGAKNDGQIPGGGAKFSQT